MEKLRILGLIGLISICTSFLINQYFEVKTHLYLIFAVMGFFFVSGLKKIAEKRFIENIPTSKVRSIAMGIVEVYGKVLLDKQKAARGPFSGNEYAYYVAYIDTESGKRGKRIVWDPVSDAVAFDEQSGRSFFYLKDETGKVLVDPSDADFDFDFLDKITEKTPVSFELVSEIGKLPDRIAKFLEKNSRIFGPFIKPGKKISFREYGIKNGDGLYVIGTAGDNPLVREGTSAKGPKDIMIGKGKHDKMFKISEKSEKRYLRRISADIKTDLMIGFLGMTVLAFLIFMDAGLL